MAEWISGLHHYCPKLQELSVESYSKSVLFDHRQDCAARAVGLRGLLLRKASDLAI